MHKTPFTVTLRIQHGSYTWNKRVSLKYQPKLGDFIAVGHRQVAILKRIFTGSILVLKLSDYPIDSIYDFQANHWLEARCFDWTEPRFIPPEGSVGPGMNYFLPPVYQ